MDQSAPPHRANTAPSAIQLLLLHQIHQVALHQRLPIETIRPARANAAGTHAQSAVDKALGYFERNVERMQYGTFRAQGFFIGSGVVEAGCKSVIGGRCKQSGMRWSVRGAENILAFRCIQSSRRLDEFWKHHLNQRAAENDCLHLAA